jgi:photosynthetic reaction center cytochrome c subunit
MTFRPRRTAIVLFALMTACILQVTMARGQARPQQPQQQQRPPMAEEVFKNIAVLKGIPVDEFMDTMGMFSAATSLNCISCHTEESAGSWERFADDTPLKITARRMVLIMNNLNKNSFGGERRVTCFTCHNGNQKPRAGANLALQYREVDDDPNEIEVPPEGFVNAPTPDAVLNKYIQAVGGAQRVNALTSIVAKGTYSGFDTEHMPVPIEIYAKAPNQRAQIIHALFGDNIKVFNGTSGWHSTADKPVPLITLTGGNLDGVRIEALVSFPAHIKEMATNWRVGSGTIDAEDVQVLQGTTNKQNVSLYFNQEGLLVRLVRHNDTAVGSVPTQIDFSDYRDVNGVKIPFKFTTTWTDNRTDTELTEVRTNVPIEAARFNQPAPAPPPKH